MSMPDSMLLFNCYYEIDQAATRAAPFFSAFYRVWYFVRG